MAQMTGEPDPVDDAWSRLEARWEDDEAHRKFIALCAAMGRLPEAARRYREVRENDESRRERAAAQIDRLLAHAMSTLESQRSEPPRNIRPVLVWIAAAITIAMILAASWLVIR